MLFEKDNALMNTSIRFSQSNTSLIMPLLLALLLIGAVLAGIPLPLIADPRSGLVLLAALGLIMCVRSEGHSRRMADPDRVTALFAALGGLAGFIVLASLLNVSLPFIPDYRAAFVALALIMGLKVLLVQGARIARGRS